MVIDLILHYKKFIPPRKQISGYAPVFGASGTLWLLRRTITVLSLLHLDHLLIGGGLLGVR